MATKQTEQPGPGATATADPPIDQGITESTTELTGLAVRAPATAMQAARAGTMHAAFAGLIPSSIGEAVILAGHLTKSMAVPASLRNNADTMLTVIMAGMELGLTPIRAVQSITNISGTLCMKADLQLALVKGRPGVLAVYDEGFERAEVTDANLAKRIQLALQAVKPAVAPERIELAIEKIASAVSDLKPGDPYGWALGMRQGDPAVHVRTFTYADAMKAVIYEKDENNPGAPKERKPLAEKFNYKSFPGDMYPKRARTRLLQVLAPDVTNGLPAAEAIEGGQIIDAEFTVNHQDDGDDVDTLLAAVRDSDSDTATTIEAAFRQLSMGRAAQLQKLVQFKGKPKDLVDWLKTEYANRKGVDRKRPDVLSGDPEPAKPAEPVKTEPAKPAAGPSLADLAARAAANQGGGVQAGDVIDAEVTDDDDHQPEPAKSEPVVQAKPEPAKPKPTNAKDLAARFKSGMKTF